MKSKSVHMMGTMFNSGVVAKSLKLSLFVGTILNLINNWNFLFRHNFGNISLVKVVLTYFVPFAVSAYSISKTKMELTVGNKLPYDVSLKCSACNRTMVKIKSGELIPICDNCKERTSWK